MKGEDRDATISRRDIHIRELESELHSTQTKLRSDTQRFEFELEKAEKHLASTEAERDQIERLRVDAPMQKQQVFPGHPDRPRPRGLGPRAFDGRSGRVQRGV